MHRKMIAVIFVPACVGSIAAWADDGMPFPLPSKCASVPANATLTLSSDKSSVEVKSPVSYGNALTCNRYVVDIKVPYNSTPPAKYFEEFSIFGTEATYVPLFGTSVPLDECTTLRVDVD